MTLIGVVTSIPTDPPGTGTAAASFETTVNNVLEITGKCSAGAGDLVLLRWFPRIGSGGEWRPWKEDRPIAMDSAAFGGYFSGSYVLGKYSSAHWLMLNAGGVTVDDCYAAQADYARTI